MLFRIFTPLLGLVIATAACSNKAGDERAPATVTAEPELAAAVPTAPPASATTPPIAEVTARALLAERFRAAGFTIKYDVRLRSASYDVTVDGFDPVAGVGYEYIDVAERDTDLVSAERSALAADDEVRILVIDAVAAPRLEAATASFLAGLAPDATGE